MEYGLFNVSNRIEGLIRTTGLNDYAFSKESGIPYSTLKKWLNQNPKIYVYQVEKICGIFRITLPEFFKEHVTEMDYEEYALRFLFSKLSPEQRKQQLELCGSCQYLCTPAWKMNTGMILLLKKRQKILMMHPGLHMDIPAARSPV